MLYTNPWYFCFYCLFTSHPFCLLGIFFFCWSHYFGSIVQGNKNRQPGFLAKGAISLLTMYGHIVGITLQQLTKSGWKALQPPPLGPHLSLWHFHLFGQLWKHLKSQHFSLDSEIQVVVVDTPTTMVFSTRRQSRGLWQNGMNAVNSRTDSF